jgi:hypothetical protein
MRICDVKKTENAMPHERGQIWFVYFTGSNEWIVREPGRSEINVIDISLSQTQWRLTFRGSIGDTGRDHTCE